MLNILLILSKLLDVGLCGTINPTTFFKTFSTTNLEVTALKLNTEYIIKFEFTLPSSHDPSTDYFKIKVTGFTSLRNPDSSKYFKNPIIDGSTSIQFSFDNNLFTPQIIFYATTGASLVDHTCQGYSYVGSTGIIIDQSDTKTFTLTGGTISINSISPSNRIFNQKSTYTIKLTFENSLLLNPSNSLTFTKPLGLQSGTPITCSGNPLSVIQCTYDSTLELITISALDSTKTQTISLDFTNPQQPTTSLTFNNFNTKIDNVLIDTSTTSLLVTGYNDGILTDIQIDSGSYKVGQSGAFIKYTFTNINDIEPSSQIELTLPSDIQWDISSKSCSLSVAGVIKVCNYDTSLTDGQIITVTITISNSIPGGTSIILTINSIRTPYTFKSATGFSFKIFKDTVEFDKKLAFGSLTMTQQSGITLTNLARSVTENGAQSTYTFETTFETEQPVNTKITFTLSGYLLDNVNKVEFNTLTYIGSNLLVISSAATITIELTAGMNKNIICLTKIYNVVNKDSIGTIKAETVIGTYKISSTDQGTALTVPIGTPNTITIVSMNLEKKLLGVVDTYYFSTTLFNLPPAGSTIIVTMPENFSVENNECKTAVDKLVGFTVDTCQVNSQEINIKVINAISVKNIEFRLNNLIRNPKVYQSTYFFQIRTQRDTTIIDESKSSDSLLQFKLNCVPTPSLFCKECDISNNCLSCYTDISITTNIYLLNSKCVSTCGQKYYSDSSNTCKTCPDNCLECTSSTLCQSCIDDTNYEIKNSKCVKKCTEKQFDYNGICTQCNDNCNTCIDQSTKCTSCGTTNNLLYQNKCVSQCPTGIFQVGFSCIACTSPCKTCSTGPTVCLTCVVNYYYKKASLSCVSDCGNRYFKDGSECTQCSDPCNNCSSSTICIDCIAGYYFFNNSCISTIPNGYYKQGTFLIKCLNICGNCISETECTSCPTNKYLLSKQCIDKCPDKYYSLNFVCYSCDTSCLLCSSSTVCTLCPDNYQHLSGKCYQNCPIKYYSQDQQCLQCQSSCATCVNGLECKTCPTSLPYLSSNICVSSCLINYYIKEFACVKCSNECATCDEKGCLTCIQKYKYLNQTCVTSCPSGYQDLNNLGTCEKVTSSEEKLISNLQENKYIPIPFTIVSVIMILSVAVAKISKSETFIPGSAVGLLGLIIVGSWTVLLILQLDYILEKLEMYLLIGSIGVHIILNLINLCVIKHSTKGDIAFNQWYAARKSNSCAYIFLNVLSVLSFTMTRFYFSRYFGFRFLKCRLSDVENMVGLNIINGLCAFFCCIPALIASVLLAYRDQLREQLFISSIDSFIVTIIFAICLICETQKDANFFEEKNNASAPHSLQIIPDYYQTKQSKRLSFDESINGQQFNKNDQDHEPSFPKIDESIEIKDNQSFQKMIHSKMIFKQEIPDPKNNIFNRSQEEMSIKIHSNDVSEPLSVVESQREYQNKIQEQKRIEELQRQEELKRLELERRAELTRIEDEIKQQEIERARREKELLSLEEQKKQQELLIQQQQEAMRLEKIKEEQRKVELTEQEERRIAELKRIEEELQAERQRQEELKIKQQEEEQRRLQEELEQKKREEEIKQLLEEQRLQALKEQELLQSKLNEIILVDQNDDDVGWNMEDEENQEQSIDQGYQKQKQKEVILDENNDAEDNWDVPTSGFVSIQPKSNLKKDKQIEEPQNPFRGENQRYAVQSDLLKFSSDDEEDWATNQISPSEFNALNQRYNQNDHAVTQVDRSNVFSSTGQNFTSLMKRPTQPDPETISDNDSVNQCEQFPKVKQSKVTKKQNQGQHKKMQLQRQKIQQKGKQNIKINDIQF